MNVNPGSDITNHITNFDRSQFISVFVTQVLQAMDNHRFFKITTDQQIRRAQLLVNNSEIFQNSNFQLFTKVIMYSLLENSHIEIDKLIEKVAIASYVRIKNI